MNQYTIQTNGYIFILDIFLYWNIMTPSDYSQRKAFLLDSIEDTPCLEALANRSEKRGGGEE